ncbi:MAG: hypothetical protein ACLR1V_12990 [Coprococcus sp.]
MSYFYGILIENGTIQWIAEEGILSCKKCNIYDSYHHFCADVTAFFGRCCTNFCSSCSCTVVPCNC